jgi:scyllo-inositol 2-dehydrogenase (NADP+)
MNAREVCGVGIIGYGPRTAARTFHVPLVGVEPRLKLRAVSARAPEAARTLLSDQDVAVAATPEEIIAHPDVDLAVIALPNALHYDVAKRALEADKHVVVEKPLADTTAQVDELMALAADRGLVLSQFHNRRWDGGFLTVKKLLTDRRLGHPTSYEANYDRWEPQAPQGWRTGRAIGAGVLKDLGVHLIDQTLDLFGRPQAVTATIRTQRKSPEADEYLADDYFALWLDYGRMQVKLGANLLAATPGPRYKIGGTLGMYTKFGIDYQAASLNHGWLPGDPGWGEDRPAEYGRFSDGTHEMPVVTELGSYQEFYRGIAAAIFDGTALPAPVEDARDTMAIIEAAIRSDAEGRRITSDEINLLVSPKIV